MTYNSTEELCNLGQLLFYDPDVGGFEVYVTKSGETQWKEGLQVWVRIPGFQIPNRVLGYLSDMIKRPVRFWTFSGSI